MTFPLRGADGVFRMFLTRIAPVRDADGRVRRWLGTNVDVVRPRGARRRLNVRQQPFASERLGSSRPTMNSKAA